MWTHQLPTPNLKDNIFRSLLCFSLLIIPRSNYFAVVPGIYQLQFRLAVLETWHPGGHANFQPFSVAMQCKSSQKHYLWIFTVYGNNVQWWYLCETQFLYLAGNTTTDRTWPHLVSSIWSLQPLTILYITGSVWSGLMNCFHVIFFHMGSYCHCFSRV